MREPAARGGGGAAVTVAVEAREGATDLLIRMFYPKRGWERGARRRRLAADGDDMGDDDATNERGGGLRVCAVVRGAFSRVAFCCFCFDVLCAGGALHGALCCSCSRL